MHNQKKLKYLTKFNYGDSLPDEKRIDGEINVYGSNGIVGKHYNSNTGSPAIIIGRKGSYGKLNYSNESCFAIDTTYYIDNKVTNSNMKWLYYLLTTLELDKGSLDTGVPGLSREYAYDKKVRVPDILEQQSISDYLDESITKIDALISKKQKLVELLQEKRQVIINEAVTKGLDPNVSMKDSGVTWIGEIPTHWKNIKTKYVAKMKSGHTPSRKNSEYWEDCYIPWVSLSDVHQLRSGKKEYIEETNECISEIGLNNSSAELLPEKTVILSRTASVGFSGIISKPMATTQDFINWVCGPQILPEYLLYVLRGMKNEYNRLNMGSTHKTIYMPDALNFSTPLPPIDEQYLIVEHIRKKVRKIDELEDRLLIMITALNEYRQSLISEAVTGKINVRHYGEETQD